MSYRLFYIYDSFWNYIRESLLFRLEAVIWGYAKLWFSIFQHYFGLEFELILFFLIFHIPSIDVRPGMSNSPLFRCLTDSFQSPFMDIDRGPYSRATISSTLCCFLVVAGCSFVSSCLCSELHLTIFSKVIVLELDRKSLLHCRLVFNSFLNYPHWW